MVDIVGGAERHLGVGAVDRRRGRVDEMPATTAPTSLQHVEEAHQVGIHIGVRIDQRMAHAGLRREMHDMRVAAGEQRRAGVTVGEIAPLEPKTRERRQLGEPRLLQGRIVIGAEIVDADDGASVLQQPSRHVKADESGRAGDQNGGLLGGRHDAVGSENRHASMAARLCLSSMPCASRIRSG
jgi:hypothetical protein